MATRKPKAAEGDAIAWEQRGQFKYTVEVLKSPASHG